MSAEADLEVLAVPAVEADTPSRVRRSVPWLELVKLALLLAVAVTLVFVAVDQRRQTSVLVREDCRTRGWNYRPDGTVEPGVEIEIEKACGSQDPLAGR